jgi:hypothetical protein
LTDVLKVLDAQRQQFEMEQQSVVAQEAVAIQFVLFYKALGGGSVMTLCRRSRNRSRPSRLRFGGCRIIDPRSSSVCRM